MIEYHLEISERQCRSEPDEQAGQSWRRWLTRSARLTPIRRSARSAAAARARPQPPAGGDDAPQQPRPAPVCVQINLRPTSNTPLVVVVWRRRKWSSGVVCRSSGNMISSPHSKMSLARLAHRIREMLIRFEPARMAKRWRRSPADCCGRNDDGL